ncbi:MAG TPA: hypothetical protein VL500_08100 [Candidatus Eisenbacteria bacterium]|jgi:hypothetical protein|nr:hypothetical protein [Candidatus Eisenbacteria bacterium]
MHVLFLAFKVLAQAAFAAFVPGGGIIVALNLYRKYKKARKAKLAANAPPPEPSPATVD